MNGLIKVEQREGRQTVNARDLWEGLESKRQFGNWIQDRLEGFEAGKDFLTELLESTGGRPAVEYYLTLDTAKHLAMLERNEKGRAIRQYFIEIENTARALPTGTELMALALIEASKYLEAKDKKIAELEPKAAFFDQVADSKTALQMRDVAAALNIPSWGRNKIFAFLREQGILDDRNIPYRQFQDAGYFRVIEQSYNDKMGEAHISLKTLVYQKGVEYIRKMISRA